MMSWGDIFQLASWSLAWAAFGAGLGYWRGEYVEARRWVSYSELKIDPLRPYRRGAVTRCFKGHWYWVSRDDRECTRCLVKDLQVPDGETKH